MTTQTAVKSVPYKGKVPLDYSPYIRKGKLPHIWCAGCGHGIVLKSLLGLSMPQVCLKMILPWSPIGCSSRTPGYVDFNTLHTLHGRAISLCYRVKTRKTKTEGNGDYRRRRRPCHRRKPLYSCLQKEYGYVNPRL